MTLEIIDKEIKDTNIRALKKATCPSLSGRSKLTYCIGQTAEANILLRIDKNSGGGKFNNDWHSLNIVLDLISKAGETFAGSTLTPIFKGQSVNTAGFIMAMLKKEGLIKPKNQNYEKADPEKFMAELKALMDKPTTKPKRQSRRTA